MMFIGENCFQDEYILEIIKTKGKKSSCDFSGKPDVKVIPIVDIQGLMNDLLNEIELSDVGDNMLTIKNLNKQIGLFNTELTEELLEQLVTILFGVDYRLQSTVKLNVDITISSEMHRESELWNKFTELIKYERRFFGEFFDFEKFQSLFGFYSVQVKKGEVLYRGRVCELDKIIPKNKMGKPPKEKAKAGRANPEGISYLYLAEDKKTTIHEVRSNLYDELTIAEFQLKENINLLDLSEVKKRSPLRSGKSLAEFLEYKPFFEKLGFELSKPVRKNDSLIEYLPTQYFCEYIRSTNMFNGIKYSSAMNKGGKNIVLFDDSKVEIKKNRKIKIDDIEYKFS